MKFFRKITRKKRMQTEFSYFRACTLRNFLSVLKKTSFSLLCAFSVIFTAFSLSYAVQTSFVQEIILNKCFYFLVAEGENAQACLASAQLYGGAGLPLQYNGNEYAVYACYADKQQSENARDNLSKNGRITLIIPRYCDRVYLRTRAQKAQKNEIIGWLYTLDDCSEVLSRAVESAESGIMNQSALKNAVCAVKSVLSALTKTVTDKADENVIICAQRCAAYRDELSEISDSIVFARDLRRIHAAICSEYIRLASAYAL